MAIEIREFDTMVDNILDKVVANTTITNNSPGSVIRTIVESIVSEFDMQYYQISNVYDAMNIDNATEEDLDNLIAILGVVRKQATKCKVTDGITFVRTTTDGDVIIPYGKVVSTKRDPDGNIIEFIVAENGTLLSGQTEISLDIEATVEGVVYVPQDALCVLNESIIGISYVHNKNAISGGTEQETDDSLRLRAKNILDELGKGTSNAIRSALLKIDGVLDALPLDMARGVGTTDVVVVTSTIPPSQELQSTIAGIISEVKSAGIDVEPIYPTILNIDITVTTTGYTDIDVIGGAIVTYCNGLSIGSSFIVNQMERAVLNACNSSSMDITTTLPSANVVPTGTQIIRSHTITVNGVVYNG